MIKIEASELFRLTGAAIDKKRNKRLEVLRKYKKEKEEELKSAAEEGLTDFVFLTDDQMPEKDTFFVSENGLNMYVRPTKTEHNTDVFEVTISWA